MGNRSLRLRCVRFQFRQWPYWQIHRFRRNGDFLKSTFLAGNGYPVGLAISGNDLFVADEQSGTISEYNATSGALINGSLVTGFAGVAGLAISGSNLFALSVSQGAVNDYTTAGTLIASGLVTGLNNPWGIAVSGSNLYVANYNTHGTVGEYTISGGAGNLPLISIGYRSQRCVGPCRIRLKPLYWTRLHRNGRGLQCKYWCCNRRFLITGAGSVTGIAVESIPEPSTYAAVLGIVTLSLAAIFRKRLPKQTVGA